jgi:hypothetical protein
MSRSLGDLTPLPDLLHDAALAGPVREGEPVSLIDAWGQARVVYLIDVVSARLLAELSPDGPL